MEKRDKYRLYEKHLKKIIRYSIRSFYSKKFNQCKGDMKKTWSVITEIRGKTKKEIKPLFKLDNKKSPIDVLSPVNSMNIIYPWQKILTTR